MKFLIQASWSNFTVPFWQFKIWEVKKALELLLRRSLQISVSSGHLPDSKRQHLHGQKWEKSEPLIVINVTLEQKLKQLMNWNGCLCTHVSCLKERSSWHWMWEISSLAKCNMQTLMNWLWVNRLALCPNGHFWLRFPWFLSFTAGQSRSFHTCWSEPEQMMSWIP